MPSPTLCKLRVCGLQGDARCSEFVRLPCWHGAIVLSMCVRSAADLVKSSQMRTECTSSEPCSRVGTNVCKRSCFWRFTIDAWRTEAEWDTSHAKKRYTTPEVRLAGAMLRKRK